MSSDTPAGKNLLPEDVDNKKRTKVPVQVTKVSNKVDDIEGGPFSVEPNFEPKAVDKTEVVNGNEGQSFASAHETIPLTTSKKKEK